MYFDPDDLELLEAALARLAEGFRSLPDCSPDDRERDRLSAVLTDVADRMRDNYPYHHPLYAGQMLKPPAAIARLSYALAQWINPNNHALDGGRASSAMEKEAVAELAAMFGWHEHLGHLTGGGTTANLEALWIAGELSPGNSILASDQAHYTHERISRALKLPFETVPSANGRIDIDALAARLEHGGVACVVATIGTTGLGAVDPLAEIIDLAAKHGVRVHADAAYGGYFSLAAGLSAHTRRAFEALERVDSIVLDPHKHGLQPYGCGCVLFREPAVGRFYQHESPYTYFSSDDLHLGEISLECSRAGASAVALWATLRYYPLEPGGELAHGLSGCHAAAVDLHARLAASPRWLVCVPPELDIVVWAPNAATSTELSALSSEVFERAATENLHLAKIELPRVLVEPTFPGLRFDSNSVTCLRSVLMKWIHRDWVDQIWQRLERARDATSSP